ncbi:glycosyl transferase [Phellopilus nigrolimitatus]|nr:glycosyl transferase [Phellopilus nigrolimitatus]
MHALVTVGSTQFDDLVEVALSQPVLKSLFNKGFARLVVQCGKYAATSALGDANEGQWRLKREGIEIEVWTYKPSLKDEYDAAQMVISHAGSGTILDVLRLGKPLIVMPNPTLLDNHQMDLASELDRLGYLRASTPKTLAIDIESFETHNLQPFPPMDPSRFRNLLDEEMGFL